MTSFGGSESQPDTPCSNQILNSAALRILNRVVPVSQVTGSAHKTPLGKKYELPAYGDYRIGCIHGPGSGYNEGRREIRDQLRKGRAVGLLVDN